MAVTVFTISSVQMLNGCPTWGSNAAVSLPVEKGLYLWKIVESPSHFSSVYASCINFTASAADFFNRQRNFVALLCTFYPSIFESLNLQVATKSTFTKIVITRQWQMLTKWNFDQWRRIDHRSNSTTWLCAAMDSFAIRRELSVIFGQPL